MKTVFWYINVIILSDDQLLRRVLRVILKSIGFERIEVVGDLLELRQRQADLRHDLIVADGELLRGSTAPICCCWRALTRSWRRACSSSSRKIPPFASSRNACGAVPMR